MTAELVEDLELTSCSYLSWKEKSFRVLYDAALTSPCLQTLALLNRITKYKAVTIKEKRKEHAIKTTKWLRWLVKINKKSFVRQVAMQTNI